MCYIMSGQTCLTLCGNHSTAGIRTRAQRVKMSRHAALTVLHVVRARGSVFANRLVMIIILKLPLHVWRSCCVSTMLTAITHAVPVLKRQKCARVRRRCFEINRAIIHTNSLPNTLYLCTHNYAVYDFPTRSKPIRLTLL